jgi:hypothetical protein
MKKQCARAVALLLLLGNSHLVAQVTETFSFTSLNEPIPDGIPCGLSSVQAVSSSIVNLS